MKKIHALKHLFSNGIGHAFFVNSGWLMMEQIYRMILSLILSILTARYLGPANMGILTYAVTFATSFLPIATLSLESIAVREIVSQEEKTAAILGSGILMRFVSSMISVMAMTGIVAILNPGYPIYVAVTFLNGVSLVFQSFFLVETWLQAHLRSKYGVIIKSVGYTIMSIFKVYLLISGKSVIWFAFAVSLDMMIVCLLFCLYYFRHEKMTMSVDRNMIRHLGRQCFPFMLSAIMIVIYGQADRIILQHIEGDTALGLYGISATLCYTWQFIPASLITSATPLILKSKSANPLIYAKRLKQLYAVIWWLSILVSIMFTVFGEGILVLMFGEEYRGAAVSLKILTWSQGFSLMSGARNIWFLAENKNKYLIYCQSISAFVSIVLYLVLIPSYGLAGAALSTVLTQCFVALFSTLFFRATRPSSRLIIEAILLRGI